MTAYAYRHYESVVSLLLGTSGIQPRLRVRKCKAVLSIAAERRNRSATAAVRGLHEPAVAVLVHGVSFFVSFLSATNNYLVT